MIFGACREKSPSAPRGGGSQPRAEAEGRCPGKKGTPSWRPERSRELVLLARTETLSEGVGHSSSNDWLRNRGPQKPGPRSRDLSGRTALSISPPRASACGLRPWAPFSRPVGPDGPATRVMFCRRESAGEQVTATTQKHVRLLRRWWSENSAARLGQSDYKVINSPRNRCA